MVARAVSDTPNWQHARLIRFRFRPCGFEPREAFDVQFLTDEPAAPVADTQQDNVQPAEQAPVLSVVENSDASAAQ